MAKTHTPGIPILGDGRLFIDKRYLGVRIGAITQEQAEGRLRIEMARIEYELERNRWRVIMRAPMSDLGFRCQSP